MIEFDEIRKQVAIKHNVLLGKDDPILVTVTINEMVLSRYLELASEKYNEANKQLTIALHQQQEQSKEVAGRVITTAAEYVSKQTQEAISAAVTTAINQTGLELKRQIDDAQRIGREATNNRNDAQTAKNGAIIAASIAGASALVALVAVVIAVIK